MASVALVQEGGARARARANSPAQTLIRMARGLFGVSVGLRRKQVIEEDERKSLSSLASVFLRGDGK